MNQLEKERIKNEIVHCLKGESEIIKIIIFGSFLTADTPNDIDVAVQQDSNEPYLPLALKYRKKIRPVAKQIPVDIIPLRTGNFQGVMADEISHGVVIYER
jgi:predicted nucleotidyltransferase